LITLIDNDFNSNSDLQITLKKKKKLEKYKLYMYKQIQDPVLNTLSEAFLKYIYCWLKIWNCYTKYCFDLIQIWTFENLNFLLVIFRKRSSQGSILYCSDQTEEQCYFTELQARDRRKIIIQRHSGHRLWCFWFLRQKSS
jgi:hypothetical protein